MAWMEEEQKQMMADAAERGEARRVEYKKFIRIVGTAAFLAVVILVVDIITRDKGASLPLDLSDPEGTIAGWESDGFVRSIDKTSATVVVDENVWKELSSDEKTTIVAFLASTLAENQGTDQALISIRGFSSHELLGGIDSVGMRIE